RRARPVDPGVPGARRAPRRHPQPVEHDHHGVSCRRGATHRRCVAAEVSSRSATADAIAVVFGGIRLAACAYMRSTLALLLTATMGCTASSSGTPDAASAAAPPPDASPPVVSPPDARPRPPDAAPPPDAPPPPDAAPAVDPPIAYAGEDSKVATRS